MRKTRVCTKCQKRKKLDLFNKSGAVKMNGRMSWCRSCATATYYAGRTRVVKLTTKERFLKKIEKSTTSKCWMWKASKHPKGYGHLGVDGKVIFAHRAAWILFRGPIPKNILVCHKCDVRACVNPNHLFLGTQKDNMQDALRKGRIKTPCYYGEKHPLAKLTNDDVRHIRESTERGIDLAKKFNVSKSAISHARNERTFKKI